MPRYCVFFSVFSASVVAEELELEEPEGCALEGCEVLEPAPAAPPLIEPELGAAPDEDEAPPLALSFFWMSTEVDEELEPEGAVLGVLALPVTDEDEEPAGALVEPEPAGAVVEDELDAPAGARLLSARSQPARTAAPNAMETARARVESFM